MWTDHLVYISQPRYQRNIVQLLPTFDLWTSTWIFWNKHLKWSWNINQFHNFIIWNWILWKFVSNKYILNFSLKYKCSPELLPNFKNNISNILCFVMENMRIALWVASSLIRVMTWPHQPTFDWPAREELSLTQSLAGLSYLLSFRDFVCSEI